MEKDFVPSPNPNNLQVYSVIAIERIDAVDGFWWIEARTTCGHTVGVASSGDTYEVLISVGDTPSTYRTVRHYRGGEGSDAERVFRAFHEHYLDVSGKTSETDRTR